MEFAGCDKRRSSLWRCVCQCGENCIVLGGSLSSGNTASCGCLNLELSAGRLTKHGYTTHNKRSPTYRSWMNMLYRSENRDGHHLSYAEVRVCDRWRKFENFLADLGPRPKGCSLGRILDTGNYEPGNAFWMTTAEQSLNRRNRFNIRKWTSTSTFCPAQQAA